MKTLWFISLCSTVLWAYAGQGVNQAALLEKCDLPADEPVILFTVSWCGTCKAFKATLKDNNIDYYEIDAESSPKNTAAFACAGGQFYPHVIVDGKAVTFTPKDLSEAFQPYAK